MFKTSVQLPKWPMTIPEFQELLGKLPKNAMVAAATLTIELAEPEKPKPKKRKARK